jgi:hypothetical protein
MSSMATGSEVERSINTKIYTSVEEVFSDYTNKEDFNTLIFYKGMISVPIKLVGSNGTNSCELLHPTEGRVVHPKENLSKRR